MIDFSREFDSHKDFRDYFHECLRKEVHGPIQSDDEQFRNQHVPKPTEIYSVGMLFPRGSIEDFEVTSDGTVIENEPESQFTPDDLEKKPQDFSKSKTIALDTSEEDRSSEDMNLTNQFLPSSMGLTFSCDTSALLSVSIYFATYKKIPTDTGAKELFSRFETSEPFSIKVNENNNNEFNLLG